MKNSANKSINVKPKVENREQIFSLEKTCQTLSKICQNLAKVEYFLKYLKKY